MAGIEPVTGENKKLPETYEHFLTSLSGKNGVVARPGNLRQPIELDRNEQKLQWLSEYPEDDYPSEPQGGRATPTSQQQRAGRMKDPSKAHVLRTTGSCPVGFVPSPGRTLRTPPMSKRCWAFWALPIPTGWQLYVGSTLPHTSCKRGSAVVLRTTTDRARTPRSFRGQTTRVSVMFAD
jgi:hypothetical protein